MIMTMPQQKSSIHKPVTMRDVARHCGVSVYPVSRVLSGKPGVNEETANLIRAAAAELGYDLSVQQSARRLALRKSGNQVLNHLVAVILPMPFTRVNFFHHLFNGISDVLTAEGFGLLLTPRYNLATQTAYDPFPPAIARGEVDGLITYGNLEPTRLHYLRALPTFVEHPVVTIVGQTPGCLSLLRDEWRGGYLAVQHLLAVGHRRIGYCRRPTSGYPMDTREAGFAQACLDADADPTAVLAPIFIEHDNVVEKALHSSLVQQPRPTAVIAMNDPNALDVWFALQRLGLSIPDDVSIIGFDDTDSMPDPHGYNLLTTIHYPITDMGREAAGRLLAALQGQAWQQNPLIFPASLQLRASTAPPRV
jgi:DNA-binding LacI/PurR family transcriptional regulator